MHKNLLRKNLLMVLLLLVFMIISTGAALAQALPEPFCGKLDKADCAILADSQKAMVGVESVTTSGSVDVNLSGIPDLPFDALKLNLTQDSTMAMDPEVIKSLTDFQSQLAKAKPEDIQQLTTDYTALIVKLYQTMGLDLDFTLTMPKDVADLLSAQAGGGVQVPDTINIKLKMVDGYLYVNLDKLAEAMPELAEFKGWYGVDMVTLMQKSLEQANKRQASEMQNVQAGLGAGTFLSSDTFHTMLNDYVNVERQPDGKLDLQKVAVFNSTFDFGGFVASQAFQDLVKGQLDMINRLSDQKISPQEFDQGMMGLRFLGPALFQDLKFDVVQNIGLKDNYVYRSETHFNWDLKSLMGFAAMAQGSGKMPAMPKTAPVIGFDIVTDYADFNNTPTIEKPKDATIIPLDQMDMNSIQ